MSARGRVSARAVLFDLDGVLIDSYEVWFHLLNDAARAFEAPAVSRELFADCWGQGVDQDAVRLYPGRTIAELEEYYEAHFLDHADHLGVDPDAAGVLEELRVRGIATALITQTPSPLARAILSRAGLVLDAVVGGTDVENPKPAPDMVLAAARAIQAPLDACWVVGDSAYDRDAARAAGVVFVGVRMDGDHRVEKLSEVLALV